MKILFRKENRAKIEKVIKDNQKRARVRKMNVSLLDDALWNLELKLGIKKKDMVGIVADIDWYAADNQHCTPPQSTHIVVERTASGWCVTDVYRGEQRRWNRRFDVTLTERAKEAIVESKLRFR